MRRQQDRASAGDSADADAGAASIESLAGAAGQPAAKLRRAGGGLVSVVNVEGSGPGRAELLRVADIVDGSAAAREKVQAMEAAGVVRRCSVAIEQVRRIVIKWCV